MRPRAASAALPQKGCPKVQTASDRAAESTSLPTLRPASIHSLRRIPPATPPQPATTISLVASHCWVDQPHFAKSNDRETEGAKYATNGTPGNSAAFNSFHRRLG